jgi:hypothetical protein
MRVVPHAPPARLEGLAPIPVVVWYQVVFSVDAHVNDIDPVQITQTWERLSPGFRAAVGPLEQYASHLRAMNDAAIADPVVRDHLLKETVEGACAGPDEALVDLNAADRVLLECAATLSSADRAYYNAFPMYADADDGIKSVYDVTFGVTLATKAAGEAWRMRAAS